MKKILLLIACIVAIFAFESCTSQKQSSSMVMNIYPDYENGIIDADLIKGNDTLSYRQLSRIEFLELMEHYRRYSLYLSYQQPQ